MEKSEITEENLKGKYVKLTGGDTIKYINVFAVSPDAKYLIGDSLEIDSHEGVTNVYNYKFEKHYIQAGIRINIITREEANKEIQEFVKQIRI